MTWLLLIMTHTAVAYIFYATGYRQGGEDVHGDYPP